MAGVHSAGILVFRGAGEQRELLIAHMGGPFWARKDDGAWSIPKGECEPGEDEVTAARREFTEELGLPVPAGELRPLGSARQSTGKIVTIWAVEGDLDPAAMVPGTFELEWPRGSGNRREFPEVDRAAWCGLTVARTKLVKGQRVFVDRVAELT
ncbi:MAG TPA: NUDIX domain-containing protein [Pseudonocardiaceae bacterium]|jgi:predicted NUDIX family NTP pyrophosphohydrolase